MILKGRKSRERFGCRSMKLFKNTPCCPVEFLVRRRVILSLKSYQGKGVEMFELGGLQEYQV